MNPVEKAEQLRLRKNELARAMRARRGEELREKQREYVRRNREKVKKAYIARHKKNENWNDALTAGSLSRFILWNKPTLNASIKDFKTRFKV